MFEIRGTDFSNLSFICHSVESSDCLPDCGIKGDHFCILPPQCTGDILLSIFPVNLLKCLLCSNNI